MSDVPTNAFPHGPMIHPWSVESVGKQLETVGGWGLLAGASYTWPTAEEAVYLPFSLVTPVTVTKLWVLNGAAANGNLDIGIYSNDGATSGARIVSTTPTAQAGTNAIQSVDIADTVLGAGRYYMALMLDDNTGAVFGSASWPALRHANISGIGKEAGADPLPATMTQAAWGDTDRVPVFGLLLAPATVI